MRSLGDLYLDQSENGESRWWSFIIGFWFTILGAIFWQNALIAPIPEITEAINPEVSQRFAELSASLLAEVDLVAFSLLVMGLLVTTALTAIFWVLNRIFKGTARTVLGWLTGMSLVANVLIFIKLVPMLGSEALNATLTEMIGLSPFSYALMLMSFPAVLIGLFLVQKFIHHRSILSLHTAYQKFRWKRVLHVIGITIIVYGSIATVGHISGLSPLSYTFDPSRFFIFALISLLFIPLQAATEEILVRGYLNQALVSTLQNKWVAFVLTSLLFTCLHLANPEAVKSASESPFIFLLTMSSYFLFGFILCLIVDFEGGLEAAIGLHAANNLFAAIFVNYENSVLPTPSMFLAKMNSGVDVPLGILVLCFVTYLIYRTRTPYIANSLSKAQGDA